MTLAALADLIPGLYFLVLAALLVTALRRWYDPLPGLALATFLAVAAVLFSPVLVGGRTFLPVDALRAAPPFDRLEAASPPGNPLRGDLILHDAPALAAVRHALKQGEWPLWNPLAGAGVPLLATPESQLLSPPLVASLPLGLDRAAGVSAALAVFAALVFTFLLLRREGAGAAPALAGALAYGLGGYLQLWLGWPRANAAAFLPALLYAITLGVDRGAPRDFALLAAAAFAVVAAGDPTAAGYALLTTLAFLAVRLGRSRPAARRAGPFFTHLAIVALGAAAAAPVLLPAADWAPHTAQAQALAERSQNEVKFDPLGLRSFDDRVVRRTVLAAARDRLLAVVAPGAFGDDRLGVYWGPGNVNEDGSGFTGTAIAVLALAGAGAALRRRSAAPGPGGELTAAGGSEASPGGLVSERLFVGLAGVCIAVVAWPPAMAMLLDPVPLLGPTPDQHRRLTLVLDLALAYLAAAALTRFQRRRRSERPGGGRSAGPVSLIIAAGLIAAAVAVAYLAHPAPEGTAAGVVALRGRWFALQLAAAGSALLALVAARRSRNDDESAGGWWWPALVVAGAVAVELAVFHAPAHPPGPRRLYFPPSPPLTFLRAEIDRDPGARIAAMGGALLPEIATVYSLPDARIGAPSRPADYDQLTRPLWASGGRDRPLFAHPLRPIHDLLGVRYLLTPPGTRLGQPLVLRFDGPTGRVYERPHPLPRLFLPGSATVFRGGDWSQRVAAISDFRAAALVQSSAGHDADWTAEGDGSSIAVSRLEATRIAAGAALDEGRLLATSIYQDRGWRLLVDDEPTPTVLANGPLLAAWLPAGGHRVDLVYRPRPFVTGMLVAALAMALTCAWLGAPPRGRPGR